MKKHFKWRLIFDGNELPIKVTALPSEEVIEVDYLDAKFWIPGKTETQSIKITLFEPHDLWQGSKDVMLHLLSMYGESLEYWTLKEASVDGDIISYKKAYYESSNRESVKYIKPINMAMTEEEYSATHPDLDWDKVYKACIYALQQLHVAEQKSVDASCSAEEHRSMAFVKLREAINL